MIPQVAPSLPFRAAIQEAEKAGEILFFYEGGGEPLRKLLTPGCARRLALITGSEGGFAAEEASAASAAGAIPVGLGPRILRCETAPLAALTAAMLLTGNLE